MTPHDPANGKVHDYTQLAGALATSPVVLYTAAYDDAGMYPDWVSGNVTDILGYSAQEALAPTWWWDHVHPDDRLVTQTSSAELKQHGHGSFEYRFRRADGSWVRVLDQHRRQSEGRLVGSWTDITQLSEERHRVEVAEAHYRRLINTSPYAIYALDGLGRFTELNPAGERLLERTDLIGRHFTEVIAPDSRPYGEAMFGSLVDGSVDDVEIELTIQRPSGERRLIVLSATAIRDPDHPGAHGIARDITAERQLQEERERARAHYQRLVTTSPYAIYSLDLQGRFTEVSHAAAEMLGRPADSLIGESFAAVVAPEDMPIAIASLRSKVEGRATVTDIEIHIVRPDGERRLAHIRATPILEGDRLIGTHGIGRDITEEHARGERLLMLGAALDHLPEGVAVSDESGRTLYANASYLSLTPEQDPFALSPDGAALRREMQHALSEEGAWRGRLMPSSQHASPLEITVVSVQIGEQKLLFTLLRDVTDEIGREQQLRRAERLASVATLVGGVAHELNNPLTAIAGFAELMLLDRRPEDDLEMLRLMVREATRAAKIVADLRLLARETQTLGTSERTAVDLNDVVEHVLKLQRYTLDTSGIALRVDLAADLPPIFGTASELEQVVLNLVVNARQALEQSEAIQRMIVIRTRRTGAGALLIVHDNGPGVRADHLEHIFDPFFTTKSPGQGMGLGLSLVHRIVTEHGGAVQVDSERGRGATFSITLPGLRAPAADCEPECEEREIEGLRVLVVDDEEPIRRAVLKFLGRRGHRVEAVEDGHRALERIAETHYDVILSDLRMPGMGGEQLLQMLKRDHPAAARRLVFMTGHVARDDASLAALHPGVPVLEKPFSLSDLQRVIEEHAARTRG